MSVAHIINMLFCIMRMVLKVFCYNKLRKK